MTSLLLHENRSHASHINAIGEICAQFRSGVLAVIRRYGADTAIKFVEDYHHLHPEASKNTWFPAVFERIDSPEWQQLYVNAEHDGKVGVITIARESYNHDVDAELNRAIDWLKSQKISSVIVTGDFHLSTQMIGADTGEFFPALVNAEKGEQLSLAWSKTARRLHNEFAISVGFINGKRCLGGFLELFTHCHYLVSLHNANLGMPEVTLPVVPGMEGCHWPLRKTSSEHWQKLLGLLLEGKPCRAKDTVGWLVDYAGSMEDCLTLIWKIATGGSHGLSKREVAEGKLKNVLKQLPALSKTDDAAAEAGRKAITDSIEASCNATLAEALSIQAKQSGHFMTTSYCLNGSIGSAYTKTMVD